MVEGYERYGDASDGPMQPGDRGTVVEIQEGPSGERYGDSHVMPSARSDIPFLTSPLPLFRRSVRVLHKNRRWWYQPQALLSEKSGLTESPAVWFIRMILRAHGYDHTTLLPLTGRQVTTVSWQVGDIVVPRKLLSGAEGEGDVEHQIGILDSCFGRIVAETSSSSSSLTCRGRDSGTVLVEYIDKAFAEAAGVQPASAMDDSSSSLEIRRVRVNRLVHSNHFCRLTAMRGRRIRSASGESSLDPMDVAETDGDVTLGAAVSERVRTDLKKLRGLDINAIESITKECHRNSATLASLFAAGLPSTILAGIESISRKIRRNDNDESVSHAIASLGRLVLVIVEQLFCSRAAVSHTSRPVPLRDFGEASPSTDDPFNQESDPMEETGSPARSSSQIRSEQPESLSIGLSDADLMEDAGRASRLSSLQQRRSMLLALMSRARRSHSSSMNDLLDREAHGSSGEMPFGQIIPNLGQFRHDISGSLQIGPTGSFPLGGSWDEPVDGEGPSSRNIALSNRSQSIPQASTSSSAHNEVQSSMLERLLRGRGDNVTGNSVGGKAPGITQAGSIGTLIFNGLLGNSLAWVQASLDLQIKRAQSRTSQRAINLLQSATDEEGTPLLLLAISLGCSLDILKYLVKMGAHVGGSEVRLAAKTGQLEALALLLRYSGYIEGLTDTNDFSPEVGHVIREALAQQESDQRRMQEDARSFLITVIRELMQLGLIARRQQDSSDQCARAISGVLVGNVLLHALYL